MQGFVLFCGEALHLSVSMKHKYKMQQHFDLQLRCAINLTKMEDCPTCPLRIG